MKKILTLLLILMTISTSSCLATGRVFKKFPGNMQVSTVYVSPTALKLGMALGGGQLGEFKKLAKKLDSIEVMSTSKYSSHSALNQECKAVVERNNMELILNCADDLSKTNIYIGKLLNDDEIQDIIIETQDMNSYDVVYIKGIIDAKVLMDSYQPNTHDVKRIDVDSCGVVHLEVEKY